MKRALRWGTAAAALAAVGAVTVLLLAPIPDGPPGPEPGRALFHAHCATCHGADGRGGSWRARLLLLQPGNLADPRATALPEAYLADIIRHGGATFGKPGMPSFGFALSDAEIRALVVYLRALPAASRGSPGARRRIAQSVLPSLDGWIIVVADRWHHAQELAAVGRTLVQAVQAGLGAIS